MSARGPDAGAVRRAVRTALEEDLGSRGDVTGEALLAADARVVARLVARHALVVAGLPVAREVFLFLDPSSRFSEAVHDGDGVPEGTTLATVVGLARAVLAGERTALNFLMRMSGIATAAREAVEEVRGTGAVVLDTRKTAPGLRLLDKYAVAAGGGSNHRMGLYDAVMIKDTHLAVGLSIGEAVRRALAAGHPRESLTVEVGSCEELQEAIDSGAGRALLDNMDAEALRRCVAIGRGRICLEASGGLRPGRLREVAETGVDCLSLGWLTHSAPAADIAMELERTG